MTRRFVLLSTQRSGSTWVIDVLNDHPRLVAYSELFLQDGRGRPIWGGAKDKVFWAEHLSRAQGSAKATRDLLFEYLDDVLAPRAGIAALGFKLMYGQLGAHPDLWEYLSSRRAVFLHLIRKNLLDIVLSRATAAARDVHHARAGLVPPPIRVQLDTARLVRELERLEREREQARERLSRSGLFCAEVFYEELCATPSAFERLFEFLGAGPGRPEPSSSLRKLNTAPQEELIENYDGVRRALADTRFAGLLR